MKQQKEEAYFKEWGKTRDNTAQRWNGEGGRDVQ